MVLLVTAVTEKVAP